MAYPPEALPRLAMAFSSACIGKIKFWETGRMFYPGIERFCSSIRERITETIGDALDSLLAKRVFPKSTRPVSIPPLIFTPDLRRTTFMRIYNLFPLLAGKFTEWPAHLKRAHEMGFDWIFVNPIQKTGHHHWPPASHPDNRPGDRR